MKWLFLLSAVLHTGIDIFLAEPDDLRSAILAAIFFTGYAILDKLDEMDGQP